MNNAAYEAIRNIFLFLTGIGMMTVMWFMYKGAVMAWNSVKTKFTDRFNVSTKEELSRTKKQLESSYETEKILRKRIHELENENEAVKHELHSINGIGYRKSARPS